MANITDRFNFTNIGSLLTVLNGGDFYLSLHVGDENTETKNTMIEDRKMRQSLFYAEKIDGSLNSRVMVGADIAKFDNTVIYVPYDDTVVTTSKDTFIIHDNYVFKCLGDSYINQLKRKGATTTARFSSPDSSVSDIQTKDGFTWLKVGEVESPSTIDFFTTIPVKPLNNILEKNITGIYQLDFNDGGFKTKYLDTVDPIIRIPDGTYDVEILSTHVPIDTSVWEIIIAGGKVTDLKVKSTASGMKYGVGYKSFDKLLGDKVQLIVSNSRKIDITEFTRPIIAPSFSHDRFFGHGKNFYCEVICDNLLMFKQIKLDDTEDIGTKYLGTYLPSTDKTIRSMSIWESPTIREGDTTNNVLHQIVSDTPITQPLDGKKVIIKGKRQGVEYNLGTCTVLHHVNNTEQVYTNDYLATDDLHTKYTNLTLYEGDNKISDLSGVTISRFILNSGKFIYFDKNINLLYNDNNGRNNKTITCTFEIRISDNG